MAKKKTRETGKACAILSYLLVGLIWYFADKKMRDNQFAKFHSKQALLIWIAALLMNPVGHVFMIALAIVGIVNAANEDTKPIPILGDIAQRLFTY